MTTTKYKLNEDCEDDPLSCWWECMNCKQRISLQFAIPESKLNYCPVCGWEFNKDDFKEKKDGR